MKNLRVAILLIAVGVLFCVSFASSFSVATSGERTTAVCTSVDRPTTRSSRRARWRFSKHQFRYTDKTGQEHRSAIRFGAFWINPEVGQTVPVIYAKESPDSIYYDSIFHVWMWPGLFGALLIFAIGKRLLGRHPRFTNARTA